MAHCWPVWPALIYNQPMRKNSALIRLIVAARTTSAEPVFTQTIKTTIIKG